MWLINVYTSRLRNFIGQDVPKYAILSHRWTHDEPSFKDFSKSRRRESAGYAKILQFCQTVKTDYRGQVEWVWVDTVCIDQRSSAELTESINSMWTYYRGSVECYVYLNDVHVLDASNLGWGARLAPSHTLEEIRDSAWFTRGWTLQELLAPRAIIFVSAEWLFVGSVSRPATRLFTSVRLVRDVPDLSQHVSEITQIPLPVLRGDAEIDDFSIAQRMSWASARQTTRLEDEAYCLLGLLGINMPLIYGEGRRAFRRLQQEIIRESDDQSIFAWRHDLSKAFNNPSRLLQTREALSVLAISPAAFAASGGIQRRRDHPGHPYAVTNLGLELLTDIHALRMPSAEPLFVVPLNCGISHQDPGSAITQTLPLIYIILKRLPCGHFCRILDSHLLFAKDEIRVVDQARQTIWIHGDDSTGPFQDSEERISYRHWLGGDGELYLQSLGLELSSGFTPYRMD